MLIGESRRRPIDGSSATTRTQGPRSSCPTVHNPASGNDPSALLDGSEVDPCLTTDTALPSRLNLVWIRFPAPFPRRLLVQFPKFTSVTIGNSGLPPPYVFIASGIAATIIPMVYIIHLTYSYKCVLILFSRKGTTAYVDVSATLTPTTSIQMNPRAMTLPNTTIGKFAAWIAISLVPFLLTICPNAHGTNHSGRIASTNEYRYEVIQHHVQRQLNDTFVAATFSGGGMRAASLAYGALTALRDTTIGPQPSNSITPPGKKVLLSEVDFVSSVSGGSVTATYWALHGTSEEFNKFEHKFLKREVQTDLITRILDPVSLLKLLGTAYSRSDALIDYYEETLFGQATYRDLLDLTLRNQDRPYLIVNATDMDTRSLFPFVQLQLDLVCEDLTKLKLAKAVAASTAYPLAFPAIALENKSLSSASCSKQYAKSQIEVGMKKNANIVNDLKKSWQQSQNILNEQKKIVRNEQGQLSDQTLELERFAVEAREKSRIHDNVDQLFQIISRSLDQTKSRESELRKNYHRVKAHEELLRQRIEGLNTKRTTVIESYNRKLTEIGAQRQRLEEEKQEIVKNSGMAAKALRWITGLQQESSKDGMLSILNGEASCDLSDGNSSTASIQREHRASFGPETTTTQSIVDADSAMSDGLREVGDWISRHPLPELDNGEFDATTPTDRARKRMDSMRLESIQGSLIGLRRSQDKLNRQIADHLDELDNISGGINLSEADRANIGKIRTFFENLEERVQTAKHKLDGLYNGVGNIDGDLTGGVGELEMFERTQKKIEMHIDVIEEVQREASPYMEKLSEVRVQGYGNRIEAVDSSLRRIEAEVKHWDQCLSGFRTQSDLELADLAENLQGLVIRVRDAYGAAERAAGEAERLSVRKEQQQEALERSRLVVALAGANEHSARNELQRVRRNLRNEERKLKEVWEAEEDGKEYLDLVGTLLQERRSASQKFLKQVRHYNDEDTKFVHLMDGGVADNVGFTPLIELLDSLFPSEDMVHDTSMKWKARTNYVAIIVVDAKGSTQRRFSKKRQAPSFIETIGTTIDSAIESKSRLLSEELERVTTKLKADGIVSDVYIVRVGFDEIERFVKGEYLASCLMAYRRIPTNWTLDAEVVDALIALGRSLVLNSGRYKDLVRDRGGLPEGEKDVEDVCGMYGEMLLQKFPEKPVKVPGNGGNGK